MRTHRTIESLKSPGGVGCRSSRRLTGPISRRNSAAESLFDRVERKLYSHDIAVFPSLFRPLVGKTLPDAIVQPENEEELKALAKWAQEQGIPLTPRGKASSGYGGVLPVKGGIVVDFYRMNRVIDIGPKGLTARIEGRRRVGKARSGAGEEEPGPQALPFELSFLHSRWMARSGRRRHRLFRGRLVQGERGERQGGAASRRGSGVCQDRISISSPTRAARRGS